MAQNAKRYSLLYLIECKHYSSKNIPVDDVEEFLNKISQVSGVNAKGIMISNQKLSEGAFNIAKNKGLMWIHVPIGQKESIILNRSERSNLCNQYEDKTIHKFLIQKLCSQKVEGFKYITSEQIEETAKEIHYKIANQYDSLNTKDLVNYFEDVYYLNFDFKNNIKSIDGTNIFGNYNAKKNLIQINSTISYEPRFNFILGHEIGHFVLHRDLKSNQTTYNEFEDPEYNIYNNRYELKNHKNMIEWQANKFSSSLFLPESKFKIHFYAFRESIGIVNRQKIYLDNQLINRKDFEDTISYLSETFKMSRQAITFRLEELDLIHIEKTGTDQGISKISEISKNFFNNN